VWGEVVGPFQGIQELGVPVPGEVIHYVPGPECRDLIPDCGTCNAARVMSDKGTKQDFGGRELVQGGNGFGCAEGEELGQCAFVLVLGRQRPGVLECPCHFRRQPRRQGGCYGMGSGGWCYGMGSGGWGQ
jgi:hypothetical protein